MRGMGRCGHIFTVTKKRFSAKGLPRRYALDAQFTHFVVVVLAVENVTLLGTLKDNFALRGDLRASGVVDGSFLSQERFKRLARLLADGIAILKETNLLDLGQRICHGM